MALLRKAEREAAQPDALLPVEEQEADALAGRAALLRAAGLVAAKVKAEARAEAKAEAALVAQVLRAEAAQKVAERRAARAR